MSSELAQPLLPLSLRLRAPVTGGRMQGAMPPLSARRAQAVNDGSAWQLVGVLASPSLSCEQVLEREEQTLAAVRRYEHSSAGSRQAGSPGSLLAQRVRRIGVRRD